MVPTLITVYLSNNLHNITEVPITPNTTASDVIQLCREPGETNCHLAEVWRGNERFVSASEKLYTILQQWGSCAGEVKFHLRHNNNQVEQNQTNWQEKTNMNNFQNISIAEMKELAKRQQQHIEQQEQMLVGKEQRLRFLRQQAQQQQAVIGENDRLKRLREKAEAQETKLKKIRSMRGKLEQRRTDNTTLSAELEAVRNLFTDKQQELSKAVTKVTDLTKQLDDLRNSKLTIGTQNETIGHLEKESNLQNGNVSELEKLRKELSILNKMNEEQQRRLNDQRNSLRKRNEDASDLDRRIEELMDKLRKKKVATGVHSSDEQWQRDNIPPNKMHTIIATVEPLKHNVVLENDNVHETDSVALKINANQPQYNPNQNRGQPERNYNMINRPTSNDSQLEQRYGNSNIEHVKPFSQTNYDTRPHSAMAQLFPTNTTKSESLTAKVQPMFAKGSQGPPVSTSPQPNINNNANQTSGSGINLFQYKPPPPTAIDPVPVTSPHMPNVTVLPSGNIKYTQPPAGHPPPPYPSGNDVPGFRHSGSSPERNIAIDIEALRRKFAHAPRPLKKRSSVTEPERQPNIPKFIYDHIYKKADTPFYRPHSESNAQVPGPPPPAYVAPVPQSVGSVNSSTESMTIPEGSVNYEHNISPTAYLKKQQQNLRKITSAIKKIKESPTEEKESPADDISSDISSGSTIQPTIKVPQWPYDKVPGKSNLKPHDYKSKGNIRFDPLALLLDASLEGEFKLVQSIIDQVKDPSGANDEGITALHNAVCAGHFDLVRFLVHYGSDINASDTDGWTPLHCAASCNNLPMAKFLVENGACIFATTISDGETAADKCEELDEGYIACSEYLYGIQDKFGFVNKGQVFALYDYLAENEDELSFKEGEIMTVIRRGDEDELEWWWVRKQEREGYIARNLLGMWPRIKRHEKP